MEVVSRSLGVELIILEVRGPDDLDGAFTTARKGGAGAVNVLASPLLASYSHRIIDLAAKSRLPAIYQWREHAEAGGLMSYGPSLLDIWRQTGLLVRFAGGEARQLANRRTDELRVRDQPQDCDRPRPRYPSVITFTGRSGYSITGGEPRRRASATTSVRAVAHRETFDVCV